ncbi:MAG: TatD family hydrolase [Anaerolineae bacterium]|nr:TatD family hydrolase [Anaerolineae bacterium]
MIDTHAHLQHHQYAQDLDVVLARAAAAGVTAAILPGTDVEDSRAAVALAERYADAPCALYAAVGVHPTAALDIGPDEITVLRALAQHPRVVAVGEIGLDYYWPGRPDRRWPCADPATQRLALEAQLALAAELGMPVIIHDRDAHEDTLRILGEWVAGGNGRTGVLHAYAAGPALLDATLALGFYVGMDGPVTFPKATDLHAVAQQTPLDRLLLETDAPYLTPHPHRGHRNEPAHLTYVVERIAELRGATPEPINDATTRNAQRIFKRLNV